MFSESITGEEGTVAYLKPLPAITDFNRPFWDALKAPRVRGAQVRGLRRLQLGPLPGPPVLPVRAPGVDTDERPRHGVQLYDLAPRARGLPDEDVTLWQWQPAS